MKKIISDIRKIDKELAVIFIIASFSLIGNYYLSNTSSFEQFLRQISLNQPAHFLESIRLESPNRRFFDLAFWVSVISFNYLLLPGIFIATHKKLSFEKLGFSIKNLSASALKNYAVLYLFMLPVIYMVAQSPSFLQKYPFYKPAVGEPLSRYFIWWEILYFIQFIGVEFFFRGFLIHTTKHRFGIYSIFVSVLPYVMIHFGKPMPETIGAIGAGLILGILSYESKSIIPGIFLHYAVAITMDILAL